MKFRDVVSIKQIVMTVAVLALFILLGLWDSATQVKVSFLDTAVKVRSDRYQLEIPYDQVASAELTALPEAGVEVNNGLDDKTLRTGFWENETWGRHHIIADLESDECIVVHLDSGEIFVFSCKDTKETQKTYDTFLGYLD